MILGSVRVRGWRCFAEETTVGPFSPRLNVLHGPNAVGKSTLFEAVTRGLLDDHKVKGNDVDALRPWGRDLAPSVTVEFEHAGTRYRISKQFLEEAFSRLERLEGDRFVLLAEREAAVERARALISASSPARGLTQLKNWGLAQVLWAVQRGAALGDLTADVVTQIQARLSGNGAVRETASGPLERRIAQRYGEIFTGKGELKRGKESPPVVGLRADLETLIEKEKQARENQRRFEDAARELEDLRASRSQAARDAMELRDTHRKANAEAEEQRRLLGQKREYAARLELDQKRYKEAQDRVAELRKLGEDATKNRECLARIDGDGPTRERDLELKKKEEEELSGALLRVRDSLRDIAEEKKTAELAAKLADLGAQLRTSEDRLAEARKAAEALAARKSTRAGLLAPDAKRMPAIRKAFALRNEAQVRLESSLITLEIVPLKDDALQVLTGEKPGEKTLVAGQPLEVKGAPRVLVDVRGFGRIGATGPAGSAEELRKQRDDAAMRLADLIRGFGAQELEELESLHEKAKRLDDAVAGSEAKIAALLAGERIEDLENRCQLLSRSREEILGLQPDWRDAPPDPCASMAGIRVRENALVGEVHSLEARWKAAYAVFQDSRSRLEGSAASARDLRSRGEELRAALAELEADGKTDASRALELTQLAIKATAAEAELAMASEALARIVGDPADLASILEKQLQQADRAQEGARTKEIRAETLLSSAAQQGTYSALAEVEEEKARLQSRLAREELRTNAIRLLFETVQSCREEARAAIAGPIEQAATRILEQVGGRRLGRIVLSEAFGPSSVSPEAAGTEVSFDRVSGGEMEQAHLAARLALAGVLARDERQLAVLDDVLGATDSARHARILRVLEEASDRLQILVITCHPERYRALEGATFIDLEEIVKRSGRGS